MPQSMKPGQRRKWAVLRQQGEGRFVILHGILRMGLSWGLILSLIEYLIKYGFSLFGLGNHLAQEWFWIIFRASLFGVVMGFSLWRINEKAFLAGNEN